MSKCDFVNSTFGFLSRGIRTLAKLSRKSKSFGVGVLLLLLISLAALLGPVLAPHDPLEINVWHQLSSPDATYPLGTDNFGRCILSRVLYGSRLSILIGASVVALSTAIGVMAGAVSGYYRRLDNLIMRIMDGLMAFPGVLLALAIMAVLGPNTINVIIAVSIVVIPRMARLVRSSVLQLSRVDIVEPPI